MASGSKSRKLLRKAEVLGFPTEEIADHWLIPVPIYSKRVPQKHGCPQGSFQTSAFQEAYQVPWETLAVLPSTLPKARGTVSNTQGQYPNTGIAKPTRQSLYSNAYTTPYSRPPPRRTLSGRLARKGTKNSALRRAQSKNSNRTVPFKDAVNAMPVEERVDSITLTLEQYIFEKQSFGLRDLEDIIQTLALQTDPTMMKACAYLLKHGFFFSIIKVSYTNGNLHRKLLRDLKLLLDIKETSTESCQGWNWHAVDCELFIRQFQSLHIINHYRHVKHQLASLEKGGGTLALVRIEQDMLMKVVMDFLDQLGPDSPQTVPCTPLLNPASSTARMKTMGTQTFSDEEPNVQVVLKLNCNSARSSHDASSPALENTKARAEVINGDPQNLAGDSEAVDACSAPCAESVDPSVVKEEDNTGNIPSSVHSSLQDSPEEDSTQEHSKILLEPHAPQEVKCEQEQLNCALNQHCMVTDISQSDQTSEQNISEKTGVVECGDKSAKVEQKQQTMEIVCFRPKSFPYSTGEKVVNQQGNRMDQSTMNETMLEGTVELVASESALAVEASNKRNEGIQQELNVCAQLPASKTEEENEPIKDIDEKLISPPASNTLDGAAALPEDRIPNQSSGEASGTFSATDHEEQPTQGEVPVVDAEQDTSLEVLLCTVNLRTDQEADFVTVELKSLEQGIKQLEENHEDTKDSSVSGGTVVDHSSASEPDMEGDKKDNNCTAEDESSGLGFTVELVPSSDGVSLTITQHASLEINKNLKPALSASDKESAHLVLELVPHAEGVSVVLKQEELCDTELQPLDTSEVCQEDAILIPKTNCKSESEENLCVAQPAREEDTKYTSEEIESNENVQNKGCAVSDTLGDNDGSLNVQECQQGGGQHVHLVVDPAGYVSLVVEDKSKTDLNEKTSDQLSPLKLLTLEDLTNVTLVVNASGYVSVQLVNTSEANKGGVAEENLENSVKTLPAVAKDQETANLAMAAENPDHDLPTIKDPNDQVQPSDAQTSTVGTTDDGNQPSEAFTAEDSHVQLASKLTDNLSIEEDAKSMISKGDEQNLQADSRVQELAEEAALLEAQINEETAILQKEKESLEQHVENLMKILEEQQESKSRASTPEDLQLLQEQQKKLMEEIAAEKHRLSAVAGTLTACFNSPRLDTPPEVGQDRVLPVSNGEALTSFSGTLGSAVQEQHDSLGEPEAPASAANAAEPATNHPTEAPLVMPSDTPEAKSTNEVSVPCEVPDYPSQSQQEASSPGVNEINTTITSTQPLETDEEVSLPSLGPGLDSNTDAASEIPGKAEICAHPQTLDGVTEQEATCSNNGVSDDSQDQPNQEAIEAKTAEVTSTIVWDDQAQKCSLKLTTTNIQVAISKELQLLDSDIRDENQDFTALQSTQQVTPQKTIDAVPASDNTSSDKKDTSEIEGSGSTEVNKISDAATHPALENVAALNSVPQEGETAHTTVPVCPDDNSASSSASPLDAAERENVQVSSKSAPAEVESKTEAATESSESIEQTPCEEEKGSKIENDVVSKEAASQAELPRGPEPLDAQSKKLTSDSQGITDTIHSFQEHLAQTKKIASVLQSCQKPAVLDGAVDIGSSTSQSNANDVSGLLNFSPEDAAKLALLTEELKKSPEFDEPPTEDEINKFAEYMGMDLQKDKEFLYIAEWALTAPLPAGWTVHLDSKGNEFYYNTATKVSQYDHPMDGKYRELFLKSKAEKAAKEGSEADVGDPCG